MLRISQRHVDIMLGIVYGTSVVLFCGTVSTEILKYFTIWAILAYAICMLWQPVMRTFIPCLCTMTIAVLIGYTMIISLNPWFEIDLSRKFNVSLPNGIATSVCIHVLPCMYFIYRIMSTTPKQPIRMGPLSAILLFLLIYTMIHPSPSKTYNIRGIDDMWLYGGFIVIILMSCWIYSVM